MEKFPTLSPKKAIEETTNWRTFYAKIYNESNSNRTINPDGEGVFRGFRIPLEDFTQIVETINKYNADENHQEKINSVRAYLAKSSDDTSLLNDIHVLFVPVIGGKKIEPNAYGSEPDFGTDLLEIEGSEGTESTIYDFTTPCPTECDTKSKLYSNQT